MLEKDRLSLGVERLSGREHQPSRDFGQDLTFSVNGTISLASSSDLSTITDDLIDGPGAADLTIRQNDFPSGDGRVLAADVTLNVQDITIENGDVEIPVGRGGGIANNGGTLNVTNSAFSNNSAGFGGGIYNDGGTLDVTGSTFSGNSALDGGGIYNDGGTATVTNSTFADNVLLDVEESGGGIYNDGGTFEVTNSTLSGNSAKVGANILNGSGTMIYTADGEVDAIFCNCGRDTVEADRNDKVSRDCEKVTYG